jgi:hypothetical protein
VWRIEDWSDWLGRDDLAGRDAAHHRQVVRQIVRRLPRRTRGRALELTRGPGAWGALLRARYATVETIDLARADAAWPRGCDLVLAVDAVMPSTLDADLWQSHGALADGGMFLATLRARPRAGQPFAMGGAGDPVGLHEVELQYRLRRAGFQGLRLGRLRQVGGERLLCLAVRRGWN